MPDDGASGDGVKIVDRRRFTPEGEARAQEPDVLPPEDDRDLRLLAAEAQVDDLVRKLANQIEETKASRARMEREKQRVLEQERAEVAQALLGAIDELERVLAAGGSPEPGTPLASMVEGVRLTLSGFAKRIADLGAERLELVGRPFDPALAEAIDLVPVDDPARDQMVVQEVQAGYRIGERLLRPARVRVGRAVQS